MGIKYRQDDDLTFIQYCSEDDIRKLAFYLMNDKDGEKRIASEIADDESFKLLHGQPDKWRKSWKLVAGELQHFGGDSIVNLLRREGVLYKEILSDVCDKIKVKHNKKDSAYDIENLLIARLVEISWEKMSDAEKQEALDFMNISDSLGGISILAIINIIKTGRFGSLQWSSWLANSAQIVFGDVAIVGAGAAAAFIGGRGAAAIAGPLAAIALTVPLLSGAAYRVTMPAVIQIAYMRRKYEQKDRF